MEYVIIKKQGDKHLEGKYAGKHRFAGVINEKQRVDGCIEENLLKSKLIKQRHGDLAREMNHKSLLEQPSLSYLPEKYQNHITHVKHLTLQMHGLLL